MTLVVLYEWGECQSLNVELKIATRHRMCTARAAFRHLVLMPSSHGAYLGFALVITGLTSSGAKGWRMSFGLCSKYLAISHHLVGIDFHGIGKVKLAL